ncbi:baseplate J/gp47 family protein [Bengtsoniella intestinalis]|uniref:baseplate J/gp47 family protein n=1 Tax=Bengtsoniella intestinalis TaxID=3073143 RepID=UPI00391F7782
MLSRSPLNDKTYGALLAEAVAQISLYSKEWTNFNPSDPGITTLENLTACTFVQRAHIATITDQVRREMLKLLGCDCGKTIPLQLLVQPPCGFAGFLPAHQQLTAGEMAYEVTAPTHYHPWQLKGFTSTQGGVTRDLSHFGLRWDGVFHPFGKHPQVGDCFTLLLDAPPHMDGPIYLWVEAENSGKRTPFAPEQGELFGQVTWQYHSTRGWVDVTLEADHTHGLLASGGVICTLDGPLPAPLSPEGDYGLRCVLTGGHYDLPPKISRVAGNLLAVEKQRQCAYTFTLDWAQGQQTAELSSALAAKSFVYVYVKEGEYYRLYQQGSVDFPKEGRYYYMEPTLYGLKISFPQGGEPAEGEGAVKVVCYDEQTIHRRSLGAVYGFADQFIPLDNGTQVVEQDFSLLACCPDGQGGEAYCFVSPNGQDEDQLCYTIDTAQGGIAIQSPGMGTTYTLYLAHTAISEEQSLPAKQVKLSMDYQGDSHLFEGVGILRKGQTSETLEQLRERFSKDMKTVKAAVLPEDYMYLASHVPGLCIHKVGLEADSEKNLVKLAIKPYTNQQRPTLSQNYIKQISDFLEHRRMVTTRIAIVQPRYVAVDVVVTVYGDPMEPHLEERVTACLTQLIDGIEGDIPFGATLSFHQISQTVGKLSGVRMVQDLRLMGGAGTQPNGPDLQLNFDCLPYLAQAHVKVLAMETIRRGLNGYK